MMMVEASTSTVVVLVVVVVGLQNAAKPYTLVPGSSSGLAKFDWKVVAQWATKDSTLDRLVAQQWLVVARQCNARNGGIWWHLEGKL